MTSRRFEPSLQVACAAFSMLALGSCASLNREGAVAPLEGGNVVVIQGAPLVINLSANPPSGYGWELTSKPGDAVWLVGGPDFTPEPKPAGMLGVGGTTTYRFRAMVPGSQTLEFAYRQTWEQGVPPAQVVRYDVTVKSAGWRNWF